MKTFTILTLLATTAAVASLLSGATYLGTALLGGLPAGNAVAAVALVFPAAIAVLLCTLGSLLRTFAVCTLCATVAWLAVSIALAGNLALNFTGWRGTVWMVWSVVVLLGVLCALVWSVGHRFLVMRRRADSGGR